MISNKSRKVNTLFLILKKKYFEKSTSPIQSPKPRKIITIKMGWPPKFLVFSDLRQNLYHYLRLIAQIRWWGKKFSTCPKHCKKQNSSKRHSQKNCPKQIFSTGSYFPLISKRWPMLSFSFCFVFFGGFWGAVVYGQA